MIDSDKPPSEETESSAAATQRTRRRQPGPRNADGRNSSEQLKINQERLGVGADHRTDAMKKGKRGTFP
jgi:hypothetical protein